MPGSGVGKYSLEQREVTTELGSAQGKRCLNRWDGREGLKQRKRDEYCTNSLFFFFYLLKVDPCRVCSLEFGAVIISVCKTPVQQKAVLGLCDPKRFLIPAQALLVLFCAVLSPEGSSQAALAGVC